MAPKVALKPEETEEVVTSKCEEEGGTGVVSS